MGTTLQRKALFVDESILRQAKKVLGVKTDAEAIRMSVERIVESERQVRRVVLTAERFMAAIQEVLQHGQGSSL